MSFWTCLSFFLLWNMKEHSLKNVDNQIVSGHMDFCIFYPYNGSQWDLKPFDCKQSPKYNIFLWRKKCIQVFILGWTIPLSARTGFWLVRFMGLINPSDIWGHSFWVELTLLLTFSYFPRRERRVAQVRTEPLGLKVKRSVFCWYYCCLSVILSAVCLLLCTWEMWWGSWCYTDMFLSLHIFTLYFINTFSYWTEQETRLTSRIL